MKHQKNNNGFALVTVLIIIVIFTLLGTVLINISFTNAKQLNKTEDNMQAVDLSEMGIIYYKNAFIKNAYNTFDTAVSTAKSELINQGREITVDNILNELSISVNDFKLPIRIPKEIPVSTHRFEIIENSLSISSRNLKVIFESNGIMNGSTSKITATINLNIEEVIDTILNGGSGTGDGSGSSGNANRGKTLMDITLSKDGLNDCTTCTKLKSGTVGYFYKTLTNNASIHNTIAYISGSLLSSNKSNSSIKNSHLYITENVDFENLNAGVEKLKLFVGKTATIHNLNGTIKNSTIYVTKDLIFHNKVKEIKNSKICVGGQLTAKSFPEPDDTWKEGIYTCMRFGNINESGNDSGTDVSTVIEEIKSQVEKGEITYN
ncbi:hypothetical protein [Ureibacillus endophyticus]|uniref:Uncharacterized protein n=1 Tax=Ureibacillus endophyticus TaxID=1978490 RepID=A0A494Z660_9BACL|nr:hypothetical protein [Lysinibacillus endophyticus]RKQ18040.1 hypothetical protein D8M03_06575 [Lysinibacillus endophyticus]